MHPVWLSFIVVFTYFMAFVSWNVRRTLKEKNLYHSWLYIFVNVFPGVLGAIIIDVQKELIEYFFEVRDGHLYSFLMMLLIVLMMWYLYKKKRIDLPGFDKVNTR